MKIRISSSAVAIAATLAIAAVAAVAAPASAVTLVNTPTPASQFGPIAKAFTSNGTATNIVQRFVLPTAASISKVSFYGGGANIDLSITNAVGAGASEGASTLWSVTGYTPSVGGRAWRDFNVAGLNLPAGTYFLVMASDDVSGGIWSKISRTDPAVQNAQALGTGTYSSVGTKRMASVDYIFDEAGSQAFAARVEGTPVPAPGAIGVGALAGLFCAARRRR